MSSQTLFITQKLPVKWAFSFGVVVFLFYFIHKEIVNLQDLTLDKSSFTFEYVLSHGHFLFFSFSLLFANVYCEATKWQLASRGFIHQSIQQATRAVLFGNTLGFITPSKIGEYAGRLLHTAKDKSLKGLLANFYCSLSQNIVNLFFGFLAFGLNPHFNSLVNRYLTSSFFTLGLVFTLLIVMVYFHLETVVEKAGKIEILKNTLGKLGLEEPNTSFDQQTLTTMLSWSSLRYLVYAAQYVLVCLYFGFDVSFGNMLSGIAFIFLIQSALVLPPILGLIARGEIAIVVWSMFGVATDKILVSTFTLWSINILLPALVGLLVLLIPVKGVSK